MLLANGLLSVFDADIAMNVSPMSFLLILLSSLLCGLLISGAYAFHKRNDVLQGGMAIVMVVVPAAAGIVIMLVGRNIAAALGLSGIFVLVRFRSAAVESKDLGYLFVTICSGILNGSGYVAYAIIFTVIMVLVVSVLEIAGWGQTSGKPMLLKIWVPESLDFQGVFEPILRQHTADYKLLMVRTTDFGSNCELRYRLIPKKDMKQKQLLDDIRTRNGNMNVVLIIAPQIVERNSKQVL